jgi:hypothetical protein
METNPGNPSVSPIVCGIPSQYALSGPSVRFAHNQKRSPAFNNGGLLLSFAQHEKFSSPRTPAGALPVSPIDRKCLTPSGGFSCNSLHLSLFDSPRRPLTTAIAHGIAIPHPRAGVLVVLFQTRMGGGVHHSGEPAPSCRLCLIACNSRKFTRFCCQDFNRPMALGGTSR